MKYKLMFFLTILVLLPYIVLADAGLGLLLFVFPVIMIIAATYSLLDNLFIAYITIRFVCKKSIKDKSHFFTFILKHTIVVGIVEIIILFLSFKINNFLLSSSIFAILSGVIIFFVFKYLLPKEIGLGKKQINISSLFMSILTNPAIVLLAFYIFSLILSQVML